MASSVIYLQTAWVALLYVTLYYHLAGFLIDQLGSTTCNSHISWVFYLFTAGYCYNGSTINGPGSFLIIGKWWQLV
jgi:hypothetical protein